MSHFKPCVDIKRGEDELPVALVREDGGALDLELQAPAGSLAPLARGDELIVAGSLWHVESARLSADQSYTWARLITPAAWAAQQPKPELESGAEASDAAGAASEAAEPQASPPRNRRARAQSTAPTESENVESSEPPSGEEQESAS